jgi:hypothetical protein
MPKRHWHTHCSACCALERCIALLGRRKQRWQGRSRIPGGSAADVDDAGGSGRLQQGEEKLGKVEVAEMVDLADVSESMSGQPG